MSDTPTLLERVEAAAAKAYAPFSAAVQAGGTLSPAQQDTILIAKVQAIMAGEHLEPEPAPTDEVKS